MLTYTSDLHIYCGHVDSSGQQTTKFRLGFIKLQADMYCL